MAETIRGAVSNTAPYYIRKVRGWNFPSAGVWHSNLIHGWLAVAGLACRPLPEGSSPSIYIPRSKTISAQKKCRKMIPPVFRLRPAGVRPVVQGRRFGVSVRVLRCFGASAIFIFLLGHTALCERCANVGDFTSPYLYMEARIEFGSFF